MRVEAVPRRTDRWRWLITGQVQGVGFRPFVYRLARRLQLTGFVRNDGEGVEIECQGYRVSVKQFDLELQNRHPEAASIGQIRRSKLPLQQHERGFEIIKSESCHGLPGLGAEVMVDLATCPSCVREVLSRTDRRQGYGLTNCIECGPRYSIIRNVPYDRCNTTMAQFEMCCSCHAEYVDPSDRRFHAQPIACPKCGPVVSLVNPQGGMIEGDPIEGAIRLLRGGGIVAIKGLGGFHLAVRADDPGAVDRLRQRKKRDYKPFAIMAPSLEAAGELVQLSDRAIALMQSPACPIVIAPRRNGASVAPGVAPGHHRLGVMLPYTPIHHLLLRALPALVMTSGNLSDEPLTIDNSEALQRLGPMCDALLWHDRPIQRGVDDSVLIDTEGEPILVRRSRGYVPRSIALKARGNTQGLCIGGDLKNAIAVVRHGAAILSQYLGDLAHPAAYQAFQVAIDDLLKLFGVTPRWIAHDLHPAYVGTIHARKLAARLDLPLVGIQHHHAHAVALLAEHWLNERILAVVCDGTGYGLDGSIWGGELLAADRLGFERVAHLRPLMLAGGDAAASDTARCGLALLHAAFGDGFESLPITQRLIPDLARREILCRMIRDGINCASSSGAGRVFDGVAAILGICSWNHYEAQSGMMLESAAAGCLKPLAGGDLFELQHGTIDLSPLVRELVTQQTRGAPVKGLALLFHDQFARAWAAAVVEESRRLDLQVVGLTGGVFCNALLSHRLTELLKEKGLRVLRHRLVPPNDGGLALGQAAIAAARFERIEGKDGA